MRNDPAWNKARAIPRPHKHTRVQAFSALRTTYHFSEYELHEYTKSARVCWIAYQAANRVCTGRVKKRKGRLTWKESKRYQATRRRHAERERQLAAHRKSLHGNLAHRIGLRAPGMFLAHLRR